MKCSLSFKAIHVCLVCMLFNFYCSQSVEPWYAGILAWIIEFVMVMLQHAMDNHTHTQAIKLVALWLCNMSYYFAYVSIYVQRCEQDFSFLLNHTYNTLHFAFCWSSATSFLPCGVALRNQARFSCCIFCFCILMYCLRASWVAMYFVLYLKSLGSCSRCLISMVS